METDTEYVTQTTTHYCSDYDQTSHNDHIVRRGTNALGRRVTLCGTEIVTAENSFRGPLTCIGRDHSFGPISTNNRRSLWSYVNSRSNCTDCIEYALRMALNETAMPEEGVEQSQV